MGDLTTQVLGALSSETSVLSSDAFPLMPSTSVKSALDRLASRDMVSYQTLEREEAVLTEEGKAIAEGGSHEAKVFEAVRKAVEGLKIGDLPV
jgi:phenylalanyl-tRNA synthetase alpha chain